MRRPFKKLVAAAVLGITVLFGGSLAHALLIDFSPASITVSPGDISVSVFGTLTNDGSDTVFLNGDNITVPGAAAITDFFANTPLFLDAGQSSGLIELFSFDVLPEALLGTLFGNYSIFGGNSNDPGAFDLLGSLDFPVTVQQAGTAPVPEPATLLLLGSGLAGLVGFRKKIKA